MNLSLVCYYFLLVTTPTRARYILGSIYASIFIFTGTFAQTAEQFTQAFQQNSPKMLEQVLLDWAKELPPLSKKEILKKNVFEKESYAVFKAFYNPRNLTRVGGSQFGDNVYATYNYFIILPWVRIYRADKVYFSEPEIRAYTIDQINKHVGNDSLKADFTNKVMKGLQPQLLEYYGPYGLTYPDSLSKFESLLQDFKPSIDQGVPLYLNEKFADALKKFLGNDNIPFAKDGAGNLAQATDESKQKMNFLSSFIKVYYGHWGGNWELSTPPTISKITFDKNMRYAMVEFGLIYEGGVAFLEHTKGKWNLISAKRTWKE